MSSANKEYSMIISDAMAHIEKQIEELEKNSVDKVRLRRMVNLHLVQDVKRLALVGQEARDRTIDYIYKTELNLELIRIIDKNNKYRCLTAYNV